MPEKAPEREKRKDFCGAAGHVDVDSEVFLRMWKKLLSISTLNFLGCQHSATRRTDSTSCMMTKRANSPRVSD